MTDTAVITGGAGGLGRAFGAALTRLGYQVVPVDLAGTDRLLDVTDAAAELRDTRVRVCCLLPDGIRTPMVDIDDPKHLMSFTGKRLLEPETVAQAGLNLLASDRVLASVPHQRGATVRLLGLFPSVSSRLQGTIERRARRNQQRAASEQGR